MDDEFLPTPFQERILQTLRGRALHTDDLLREVGDPDLFFSGQGGFWELRHWGFVVHDSRFGNYCPDAPPPGVAADSARAARVCEPPQHPGGRRGLARSRRARGARRDPGHPAEEVRRPHLMIHAFPEREL